MNNKAKIILRLSLSLVFLYFSLNQLLNPQNWFYLVPDFFKDLISFKLLIYINALFDFLVFLSFFLNKYVKLFSFWGFIHLISLFFILGFNPSGIRDFGLAFSMLSLYFLSK